MARATAITVGTELPKASKADDVSMELWEMTVPGRCWLQVTGYTRHNQPITKDVSVGPNQVGKRIKISPADREMNQEQVADKSNDPFLNGILVRVDATQQSDPDTASADALTSDELMAIFGKTELQFNKIIAELGEVPIRRLLGMADAMDAKAKQVDALKEQIETRFSKAASQPDAVFDLGGERRPEREGHS